MSARVVYSRTFPYGAPVLNLRGAATRLPEIKTAMREAGARWDGQAHAWKVYADAGECGAILRRLAALGVVVTPSEAMDPANRVEMTA